MKVKIFNEELERFIYSLEKATIAKILRTIDFLELFGNKLNLPHSKKIASGVFELRIRGVQEVRILYIFHKNEAVLLHGFLKKTDKIPLKELKLAVAKLQQLLVS